MKIGDTVRKKSGSAWEGVIVGTYQTKLTPEGYAVESSSHPGSVQIYPASALELVKDDRDVGLNFKTAAEQLAEAARFCGLVITISQKSVEPLAMGRHVDVRVMS